jgi:hypothetical protein
VLTTANGVEVTVTYDSDTKAVTFSADGGLVNNAPMLLVGRKSIPGQGPKDFVEWIKSKGASANFAHGGIGTNSHLCGVMMGNVLGFKPATGVLKGGSPLFQASSQGEACPPRAKAQEAPRLMRGVAFLGTLGWGSRARPRSGRLSCPAAGSPRGGA